MDQPIEPTVGTEQTPVGWYPDPFGRHERRYWDGMQWTHHVDSGGRQATDPPVGGSPAPRVDLGNAKIQRQVQSSGAVATVYGGDAALLSEPVLVVNQKAKLLGVNAEYDVFDQHGRRIGACREVGQRLIKKAVGGGGQHATHRFQIIDASGRVIISLNRPAMIIKSKMTVVGSNGAQGQIVQKNTGVFRKVRFDLESGGRVLGSINAETHQAWDFSIQDATGNEIARITKTWAGWAKERFTKADNYVVQIHRPLEEPLRCLVIAAALAVDTALKQGDPTRGSGRYRRYK